MVVTVLMRSDRGLPQSVRCLSDQHEDISLTAEPTFRKKPNVAACMAVGRQPGRSLGLAGPGWATGC